MPFSVSEYAGLKTYIYKFVRKKTCIKSLAPLKARGEGVKAIAECPAENASFFYVLHKKIGVHFESKIFFFVPHISFI